MVIFTQDTHVTENYKNGHWFGDETTGKNVDTFITKTENLSDGSIEALQNVLNDKGYMLTVNGVAGKKTLSACRNYTIENGDSGPLTKWVQSRLNSIGFDCGTADGIAGKKTMSAIAAFQMQKGLGQGYLGGLIGIDYKTWIDVAMAGNIIIMLIMAGMDD